MERTQPFITGLIWAMINARHIIWLIVILGEQERSRDDRGMMSDDGS